MISRAVRFSCLLIAFAACGSTATRAERVQAEATLLEHNEYLCSDCFFGESAYYFCFAAGDKTILARQRVRVFNYNDKSQNFFTKVIPRWTDWFPEEAKIPMSYDDKYVYVKNPKGKEVRLTLDTPLVKDFRQLFTTPRCKAAQKR